MKTQSILFFLLTFSTYCFSQSPGFDSERSKKVAPFVAYEFGEAIFNKFRSLSGEVGISLPKKHLIKLVHQNVQLTEEHLNSGFAVTVKGDKVEGSLFGFEAFYSFPLVKWSGDNEILYLSPSVGYYRNRYNHTILPETFEQSSSTIGLEISLRETNLFGLKGLYYAVTIPVRVHFNPHEEFSLGDTRILKNSIDNNIWLLVGYQF